MKTIQVRDVMSAIPHLIEPEATLRQAAQRMEEFECGSLPVCGSGNVLKGIVTDRDIVIFGLAAGLDPDQTTIGEIMTQDVYTCQVDVTLDKAADIMSDQDVRRLVVVDAQKRVVGVLSISDMIKCADSDTVNDDVIHHLFRYA
ncbi:MAG: CBS domain-containing protein [Rickettsiales bacterium]|nr:CBS domain-containing protein [Rickettsiales bacterium]